MSWLCLICLLAAGNAAFMSKFKSMTVAKDSWERNAGVPLQRKQLHGCAASTKRYQGFLSYVFNATDGHCERAHPTCLRPDSEDNAKTVMMSQQTTEFLGCYIDSASERNLPTYLGADTVHLTPDDCIMRCAQTGFAYAGVTNGRDCHCGSDRPMDKRRYNYDACEAVNCPGDTTQKCGGNLRQKIYHSQDPDLLFWEATQADMDQWLVTGYDDTGSNPPSNAVDGTLTTSATTPHAYRAWIQIQMDSSQTVKAVKIQSNWRNTLAKLTSHLEVRVGDSDTGAANPKDPNHNPICVNKLCFRSGEHHASGYGASFIEDDCVTPLTGRYISIQKEYHIDLASTRLSIQEVKVTVYCPGQLPADTCPEPIPDEDCDTALEITYHQCHQQAFGKNLGAIANLTPLICLARCAATDSGYAFAGMKSINQCFCSDTRKPDTILGEWACQFKCQGDARHSCGWHDRVSVWSADTLPVPVEVFNDTAPQKSSWMATASSAKSGDHDPAFAIDGIHNDLETSIFASDPDDAFPWIQIDLGVSVRVKGLRLQGLTKCCKYKSLPFMEVRVGDMDVSSVAAPGKRICLNKVCHTTGSSLTTLSRFDCTVPRNGRYISIQRYRQWHSGTYGTEWGWEMGISEVSLYYLE